MTYVFRSAAFAVAVFAASAAQGAPAVDQTNIPASGPLSGFSSGFSIDQDAVLLQSFTVGVTGVLTQFDLAIVGTPLTPTTGGFTVALRDATDAQLYSTHLPYTAAPNVFATDWTSMLKFTLGGAAFAVTAGETYKIAVIADPDQPPGPVNWLIGADGGNFSYAGGEGRVSYFGAPPALFGGDYGFRTWVAAGEVPEPGAWALMIMGFGVAGAGLRRRRLRTA